LSSAPAPLARYAKNKVGRCRHTHSHESHS
jgi:hypothetical protein